MGSYCALLGDDCTESPCKPGEMCLADDHEQCTSECGDFCSGPSEDRDEIGDDE
jgi:hypothetical protein